MRFVKYHFSIIILFILLVFRIYIYCGGNILEYRAESRVEESRLSGIFSGVRENLSKEAHKKLPSPHAEILLGMTTGMDEFSDLPKFYDILCDVGTIHVVVVSGFNIALVFSFISRLLGSLYRLRNLIIAQLLVLVYALFSGFESPVIRALFMGSIVYWGKYYGRNLGVLRVLIFSAQIMLLVNPDFLFSLSFQLSFLSTLSLVLFSKSIESVCIRVFGKKLDDLISSLSALILVWPLVSLKFGRISLISPLVNFLVLWTVPISTILGTVYLSIGSLIELPSFLWYPVYFLIDIFVSVCRIFSNIPFCSFPLKLNSSSVVLYYFILIAFYIIFRVIKNCRKY